ncbi:hypothetical protein F7725_003900 [Dissostichus mawsoni]|uniref:Peptidoglycan recognition protein family domain-containing protein n=1 Tax=Dissostichus mawsoni TaxID=36200 RepID=A0A7J5YBI1_DISMA|nr:hypothetical protein F7725_003900 [Dissostichus mawsoni]
MLSTLVSLFPFFSLSTSTSSMLAPTLCPMSARRVCSSVTEYTRLWQYCTISENSSAKALTLTSVFGRVRGRSRMLDFPRVKREGEDRKVADIWSRRCSVDKGSWKHSLLLAVVLASTYAEAGLNDALIQYFLCAAESGGAEMDVSLLSFVSKAVHHRVTEENQEEGVVLTPDGTTVALTPLSWASRQASCPGLRNVPGEPSFEPPSWTGRLLDSLSSPQVFTLLDQPGVLTTAQINGGMDGFVLGTEIAFPSTSGRPLKLSGILTEYYCHNLEVGGMDVAPRLISQRRRENFRELGVPSITARKVVKSVEKQRRVMGLKNMDLKKKKQLMTLVNEGVKEFVQEYLAYKGTPTNLTLPLPFLYIHHTSTPSDPCLTLQQCSADMRSMQRFHQDDRGWDDIGYRLPSQHAMGLVRDQLTSCAVGGGRLEANFTLQGHRQVVNTSCPGDTFYKEITGWEHFGEVKK